MVKVLNTIHSNKSRIFDKNNIMQTLERLTRLLGIIIFILIIFAIKIFIGLIIMSIIIVPITYLYCRLTGRSYHSVMDSSELLYRANKWGQGAIIVLIAIGIFYGVIWFLWYLL